MTRTLDLGVSLLGAARLVHPEIQVLYPVSGAIYQHLVDGTLQVASVQPEGIGERMA